MDKIKKFINYVKEAKEELNKVIFPTAQQVKQSFIAVTLMVTVVALFLSLIDLIMSSILKVVL
ncbi:preprotein translocase subunit SecE [Caminibacter pacificus]|uniref:Protein translocase subunit SecE n=1 Tax=Caminibacter pacificus TaxID=1424653 RepID=A0AAJ4RCC5_9BACT|nr:preprotein translocase subunit SecE [Caminibacter pacificus]QCI28979.1 preprotein translocase subunit SecE [Caminibacter pacificus]ROR39569.1 preprotein translocase subunit SecE [Caminibacter pacificus]